MALIETIIALALTYALLSIVASAFKEMLESIFQKRKKDFKGVIEGLLGVDGGDKFLEDARVQAINAFTTFKKPFFSLKSATLASAHSKKNSQWPSYLESKTFAAVAMAVFGDSAVVGGKLKDAVDHLKAYPVQQLVLIEEIYNERMSRVEGSFKRNAQYWLLGIGFLIAVATDSDTLNIGRNLQNDSAARAALVKLAETIQKEEDLQKLCKPKESGNETEAAAKKAIDAPAVKASAPAGTASEQGTGKAAAPVKVASAPATPVSATTLLECIKEKAPSVIGWTEDRKARVCSWGLPLLSALIGYLLTAIAISLGAPFWFDVIGKVSNIRSTLKPKETK